MNETELENVNVNVVGIVVVVELVGNDVVVDMHAFCDVREAETDVNTILLFNNDHCYRFLANTSNRGSCIEDAQSRPDYEYLYGLIPSIIL